ncbi:MAG: HD domain-containing phosphohydrolase [Planctomycetota bacterium]
MSNATRIRVPLGDLTEGTCCRSQITDQHGTVLIESGVTITRELIESMERRKIHSIEVDPRDLQSGPVVASKRTVVKKTERPKPWQRVDRTGQAYSSVRSEQFANQVVAASQCISRIGTMIQKPNPDDLQMLVELPKAFIKIVAEDADQAIHSVANKKIEEEFGQRCVQLSMLSVATAIELDLEPRQVLQVGVAALLHDLSLYLFPAHFRDPQETLSVDDAWGFRKHPTMSEKLFRGLPVVNDEVAMVMSQVHERIDGTGYPRGLKEQRVHELARIVGTVDAYLTLLTCGPGRPAFVPHDAVMYLLYDAQRGKLDLKTVEALIEQLTLYPIGSCVELSDGQRARVIRRSESEVDRPTVLLLDGPESVVDLRRSTEQIVQPICEDESREMRVPESLMCEFTWEMMEPHLGITA